VNVKTGFGVNDYQKARRYFHALTSTYLYSYFENQIISFQIYDSYFVPSINVLI